MTDTTDGVPQSLRTMFVVHFIADLLFAVPLIAAPALMGELVGHPGIDPLMARLVGAALVGIGTESLLGRRATRASFLTMLRLKMLWSGTATAGIALSIAQGAPLVAWGLLAIFGVFFIIWSSFFMRLKKSP